jgi:hypothetical protein
LVSRGFVWFSNGSFSAPIVDPNDTVNVTEGRGINNSRTACGDYAGSDGNFHGFFLSRGTFTEYDIAGAPAPSTLVPGINDPADFAGAFSLTGPNGIHQGFVSVAFVMSSESLALSEVEWVETSLDYPSTLDFSTSLHFGQIVMNRIDCDHGRQWRKCRYARR